MVRINTDMAWRIRVYPSHPWNPCSRPVLELQETGKALRITHHELRITHYELRITPGR